MLPTFSSLIAANKQEGFFWQVDRGPRQQCSGVRRALRITFPAMPKLATQTKVTRFIRQYGNTRQTFYAWKEKHAHMSANELRRLRQLEEEASWLNRLVADSSWRAGSLTMDTSTHNL